jgi:hypothetical protein
LSASKAAITCSPQAGRQERIVIPIHGNQPLKIGLLRSQMKIAGLVEDDI